MPSSFSRNNGYNILLRQKRERAHGNQVYDRTWSIWNINNSSVTPSHYKECKRCENKSATRIPLPIILDVGLDLFDLRLQDYLLNRLVRHKKRSKWYLPLEKLFSTPTSHYRTCFMCEKTKGESVSKPSSLI